MEVGLFGKLKIGITRKIRQVVQSEMEQKFKNGSDHFQEEGEPIGKTYQN